MEAKCELLRFNFIESASLTDQDKTRLRQIKTDIAKVKHELSLKTISTTFESLLQRKKALDFWLQKLLDIFDRVIKVSL